MSRRTCQRIIAASVVVFLAVILLLFVSSIRWRFPHSEFTASQYVGPGQCFSPDSLSVTSPCGPCVHFITVAMYSSRWGSGNFLPRGLHFCAGAIRSSHKCFKLLVYTNARRGSVGWTELAKAGGGSVTVVEFPVDLPKNAYSGKNKWFEVSRQKLDLLERYERQHGRKAIWVDMDTLVTTDLSCAYARAPHFIVSRQKTGRSLRGPDSKLVKIHPKRSVYGDLFMLDSNLIQAVRKLEKSGMPPPMYDLQDYFSFLLNRCDGSVIDLRALVRADGFTRGGAMCFGFDFAQGENPTPGVVELKMGDRRLHCGIRANGTINYYPAGALSFVATKYWVMLDHPQEFFRTSELMKWAKASGVGVR